MTRILRFVAVAIAIAGAIDPAITLAGMSRARIALLSPSPSTAASEDVRARLVRDLEPEYELVPGLTSDAAAAIVVGDRYPVEPVPDTLLAATVTLPAASEPSALVRIAAPREVPPGTVIHLDVDVRGAGRAGRTTDAIAVIAGLEGGRASHQWTEGETHWRAGIDVVPVGEPPYAMTVRLSEASTSGDLAAADLVVAARRRPFAVQFHEPRPSWATTFVRRALEADARFEVAALSVAARGVTVQTGQPSPLADARIDRADVLVVGGLDRLTAADGTALDRFMRERGGTVVVVPDQRIDAGAARDLIAAGGFVERLLEQPARLSMTPAVAALQASELLIFPSEPPMADVVARVPGDGAPVIVSIPRGRGRLVLSGAMDAWRYRAADNNAFDRFWQATLAGLAQAKPLPIDLSLDPPLPRTGEMVAVMVRARDVDSISAAVDGDPIRLLPEAETGVYRGRFAARSTPGRSRIDVEATPSSAGSPTASQIFLVQTSVHRAVPVVRPPLAMLASSHRGIDVAPERVADLERFVRTAVTAPRVPRRRHPMRSSWWILPFALCLSAEWWLRRRSGVR